MSGGHFDYGCLKISQFAEDLKHELEYNTEKYDEKTLAVLRQCQALIEKAGEVAHDVEWLYSGDTGEDSFLSLVKPKLAKP